MSAKQKISILGSGSWGNTLACHFSKNFEVLLWDYKAERVKQRELDRKFDRPAEGKYPDNVTFSSDLKEAMLFSDNIFSVVPLKGIPSLVQKMKELSETESLNGKVLINCAKGIDLTALKTPAEIFNDVFKEFDLDIKVAALAGPNLAKEFLDGKPMISTVACEDLETATELQHLFTCNRFRLYATSDLIGVEFCSALKNVIAIAAGAADGLELGASAKASLITRALQELRELVKLKGGSEDTLYTAAGLGDLIATCNSPLSRNYRVGYFLAQGLNLEQIAEKLNSVSEGVNTAFALETLNSQNDLRIPICLEVAKMLHGSKTPTEVVETLMSRKPREAVS
ncbi:MAG: NAD(P)H-dependent glycerol-3-phosphate dehydrogenase [Candidatus Caenarcaniphilales bacterium]|nr:NAD(P)H-dependent glycerol-3-phosphate dehydrogenase [Candidatus Caenarcaniphilales bacterium]